MDANRGSDIVLADGEERGRGDAAGLAKVPSALYYGLCAAFGAFFVVSAISKFSDPILFRAQILAYEIIGDPYAAVAAIALPWIEVLAGVALIFGVFRRGSLAVLNGALVAFLIAIISAWSRGLDIECGCFGAGEKGQYFLWVVQDGVLLALGCFLLVVEFVRHSAGGSSDG